MVGGHGEYAFLGVIGKGAYGTVYLGLQQGLDRRVAIKVLAPDLAAQPGFLERFRIEAQVMARIENPHCVKVFDFIEFADAPPWLVTEFVPGASLRSVVDVSSRLAPEQSLRVLQGALTGLGVAHAMGLVHRDVKPDNILVDVEGVSKLADFGQATTAASRPGEFATGTPAFMSPEQVTGGVVEPRSDIYSAGAVLFELLTGRAPFVGESSLAVMRMHVAAPVPDPRSLVPGLSERVAALSQSAMAKDPSARPASAEAFLAELEAAAAETYGADWRSEKRSSIAAAASVAAGAVLIMPLQAAAANAAGGIGQVGHANVTSGGANAGGSGSSAATGGPGGGTGGAGGGTGGPGGGTGGPGGGTGGPVGATGGPVGAAGGTGASGAGTGGAGDATGGLGDGTGGLSGDTGRPGEVTEGSTVGSDSSWGVRALAGAGVAILFLAVAGTLWALGHRQPDTRGAVAGVTVTQSSTPSESPGAPTAEASATVSPDVSAAPSASAPAGSQSSAPSGGGGGGGGGGPTGRPTVGPTKSPTAKPTSAPNPYPSQAPSPQEQQLLDLINQDRTQKGFPPLTWNGRLGYISRQGKQSTCPGSTVNGRSQDMADRNYFDHGIPPCGCVITDLGGTQPQCPSDGVAWQADPTTNYVAEEIALGQSAQDVNNQWMSEPTTGSHRQVIDGLYASNYTGAGIGVVHVTAQWCPAGFPAPNCRDQYIFTMILGDAGTTAYSAPARPNSDWIAMMLALPWRRRRGRGVDTV